MSWLGVRLKNKTNAFPHLVESLTGKMTDGRQHLYSIYCGDLGDVYHQFAVEPSLASAQPDVAGRTGKFQVGGNRRNDSRGDSTLVESIVLEDNRWTTARRFRTTRWRELDPYNVSLVNHHSVP